MAVPAFSWWQIVRLGLVQTALGAIVVLMTSTINRVMVVELALPATVPGALLGLHYASQILRPRWGYGSGTEGRRTPWIVGGMAVLALGGFGAAAGTALCGTSLAAGLALAVVAFLAVGLGVGAAGTSLLVLLAGGCAENRRGAAATLVWVMMIAGFAVTAPLAGHFLDPFSNARLLAVTGGVSFIAFLVALAAVTGVEPRHAQAGKRVAQAPRAPFLIVLAQVWREPVSRLFTVFVFVSMLAYSAQDLILEPYAGLVFAMSPGDTTTLTGLQHGGVLAGMLVVAGATLGLAGTRFARLASLRLWTVIGCVCSALALLSIALGGSVGLSFPMRGAVFSLGLANGIYAVGAIGSMMALAGRGTETERGTRMGVWGAAQGVAFGAGGFLGTLAADLARLMLGDTTVAYASVFAGEAALFAVSAGLALRIAGPRQTDPRGRRSPLVDAASYQLDPGLNAR